MTFMFPYIGNVIIPIDELIFFRGVGIPPTSDDHSLFRSGKFLASVFRKAAKKAWS